jgi:hypothetical protein
MVREMLLFSSTICVALIVMGLLVHRQRSLLTLRLRRLETLTEALRDPNLDAATRADLLRTVAREHDGGLGRWLLAHLQRRDLWRGLWFGAGWLMFVIGALMSMASLVDAVDLGRDSEVVFAMSAIGFAMITLPLGLREVMRRDGAAQTR